MERIPNKPEGVSSEEHNSSETTFSSTEVPPAIGHSPTENARIQEVLRSLHAQGREDDNEKVLAYQKTIVRTEKAHSHPGPFKQGYGLLRGLIGTPLLWVWEGFKKALSESKSGGGGGGTKKPAGGGHGGGGHH